MTTGGRRIESTSMIRPRIESTSTTLHVLTDTHKDALLQLVTHYNEYIIKVGRRQGFTVPTLRELADKKRHEYQADCYLIGQEADIAVLIHAVKTSKGTEIQELRKEFTTKDNGQITQPTEVIAEAGPGYESAVNWFLTQLSAISKTATNSDLGIIDRSMLNLVYGRKYLEASGNGSTAGAVMPGGPLEMYKVVLPRTERAEMAVPIPFELVTEASDVRVTMYFWYAQNAVSLSLEYAQGNKQITHHELPYAENVLTSFDAQTSTSHHEQFVSRAALPEGEWLSIGLPKTEKCKPDIPVFVPVEGDGSSLGRYMRALALGFSRVEYVTARIEEVAILAHVGKSNVFKPIKEDEK